MKLGDRVAGLRAGGEGAACGPVLVATRVTHRGVGSRRAILEWRGERRRWKMPYGARNFPAPRGVVRTWWLLQTRVMDGCAQTDCRGIL